MNNQGNIPYKKLAGDVLQEMRIATDGMPFRLTWMPEKTYIPVVLAERIQYTFIGSVEI